MPLDTATLAEPLAAVHVAGVELGVVVRAMVFAETVVVAVTVQALPSVTVTV